MGGLLNTASASRLAPPAHSRVCAACRGIAFLLLACSPIAGSTRARRRHAGPYTERKYPSTSTGLSHKETSIPGVSIWTSRGAASGATSPSRAGIGADADVSYATRQKRSREGGIKGDRLGDVSTCGARGIERASSGDCQDGHGGVGDADVEPPSRGVREEQEDIAQEEYEEVMTTEEEEEAPVNADAAPGRMLEEGGGSDSQEDDFDSDHTDEDDDSFDSFENGSGGGGDSHSEEDDEGGAMRAASRGWGKGGVRSRFARGHRVQAGGNRREGSGVVSLAKKYELDEEACFARLKELWEERVQLPLSPAEIENVSETVRAEQKKLLEAAPTEWNSGLGLIAKAGGGDASEGTKDGEWGWEEDDDSSLGLLHRLLLAEMQGEGASGGLHNRWIDRDALLQLRGAATLAHHPEYLQHTLNLPRVTRGLRLVAPDATHGMQEALARSLGHATGSKVVFLDSKALDAVRGRALGEGIPKEQVSSRQLASALLELASDDGSPFVVFLKDKGSAVMKSRGICHRLTEELKSQSSRVLFVLSTASDPSLPGNPIGGPGGDGSPQDASPSGGNGGGRNGGGGGGGGLGGLFGSSLPWPPNPNQMPPGQSKRPMQDASPKKNYIFVQQTSPEGGNAGNYLGGRSNRGGRGGRSGGRGQPGQGFGRGMPGPPMPPQMLEQLLREALKSMRAGEGGESKEGGGGGRGDGSSQYSGGAGGSGQGNTGGTGDIPPGLLEALGEALNDDEFKSTLEQIGKQLSKDMHQGFSIMFSTSAPSPGADDSQGQGDEASNGGEHDRTAHPWGAAGARNENPGSGGSGSAGAGMWQGSSNLAWLTNLRKGIMNADEMDGEDNEAGDDAGASNGGAPGGGDGDGDGRKPDTRRGVDLSPSGTELRTFASLFEDITVDPPKDAVLRQHWDAWVKEDVGKHNMQRNKQALTTALRRNMLACPELRKLDALLSRHRLTDEETGQVVLAALKLELSKAVADNVDEDEALAGSDMGEGLNLPAREVRPAPRRTAKGRVVISRHSMETAFAAVCKAYVPRPGQPMSRTREEVTALAQNDRHEQALVANVILPKDIGVTYDMIGGLGGAKELLRQCITYPLRFPHLYSEGIAKEAVKGVLLFGPPGTGKTMLAKAVATEGGATFLSVDASVIENKWLGESEKNARAVFTLARRLAPCVVFIDEVDSVLSSREKYDDTTHGTLTSVKTTLMQEWDGLRTGGDRVVVIASTNRPFDLDEAVLRRLPRRIMVDLPDAETREEILKVSMAQNRVDASVNFTAITGELEGFTGSDIKEVCREAVVRIAHEKAKELDQAGGGVPGDDIDLTAQLRPVTMDDFLEARKKLTASVSEKGRELARVWEWNDEYGEVKKKRSDTAAHHLSMYL